MKTFSKLFVVLFVFWGNAFLHAQKKNTLYEKEIFNSHFFIKSFSANDDNQSIKAAEVLKVKSTICKPDSEYVYSLNLVTHEWALSGRHLLIEDDISHTVTLILQDLSGSEWENSVKYYQQLDGNNNVIIQETFLWNGSMWENQERLSFTYNDSSKMTSFLMQTGIGDIWENEFLFTYTYNDNSNQLLSLLSQSWDGNIWVNNDFTTYTYDSNNNTIGNVIQTWAGAWENFRKHTWTFNPDNTMSSCLTHNWNGTWENYQLEDYVYDNHGNKINYLSKNWDGTNWVNFWQYIYSYNDSNMQTSFLKQYWNGSSWANQTLQTTTYDENNNVLNDLLQTASGWTISEYKYKYCSDNCMESEVYFDWSDDYLNFADSTYTFCGLYVDIPEQTQYESNSVSIYPNPVMNAFTIESYKSDKILNFELLDLTGKVVLKSNIIHSSTIDISGLDDGMYMLIFESDSLEFNRKIIKTH